MALTNYRDISTNPDAIGAGFQFEFICECCGETWKTPFKPYRYGQAAGLFRRFGYIFNEFAKISSVSDYIFRAGRATGTSVEVSSSKAKVAALEEAVALAGGRYEKCGNCRTMVCANCWNEGDHLCIKCERQGGVGHPGASDVAAAASPSCPNCQTATQGGRFCPECGFDMASTHKSCPSCSATMPRQARFCTDCGHGF